MSGAIPVIILCGGLGTRMKMEAEYRPKPMVEVAGKPLLWHIMKNYEHDGYNRFILALGYKGNYIKQFFMNQRILTSNFTLNTKTGDTDIHDCCAEDDFEITFVDTGENTLTGERVLRLKDYIDTDVFMVTYGDGLANVDVSELIGFHEKQKTVGTITGVNLTSRFGLVNVDGNGLVTGFQQKPMLHDFVNGGYMVFNKEFFDYLRAGDMIEHVFLRLVEQKQLSLYQHKDFWFCIDTIRDLEEANRMWCEDGAPWARWTTDGGIREKGTLDRGTAGHDFLKRVHEE